MMLLGYTATAFDWVLLCLFYLEIIAFGAALLFRFLEYLLSK